MSKYQKMTNEEIMKEFETVTATLYDYSNRPSLKSVKQSTIEKTEKRLNTIKTEILKRMKTD